MTLVSADCGGIFSKRPSSFRAFSVDLLGHAGLADLGGVLVDLGLDLVVLAELLLDRLELLAQEVLPLRLGHLLLDAVLDLGAELEDLELLLQEPRRRLEASPRLERVEDDLLLVDLEVEVKRHEVAQTTGLLDGGGGDDHFLGNRLAELGGVLEVAHERAHERLRSPGRSRPALR